MIHPKMKPLSLIMTGFILSLFTSGCSTLPSSTDEPMETALPTLSMTMMPSLPSENTETPPLTSTIAPTHTSLKPTFTLSPTATIELPTPTPWPTLPADEAKQMMLGLLEDNGGCRFPCWWGLTPGETSYLTIRSFLEKFETISIANIYSEYSFYASWFPLEDDLILDVRVSGFFKLEPPNNLDGLHVTMQVKRVIEGGFEVVWENPLNEQYLQIYRLPQILTTYGPPNQALVFGNEAFGHANWSQFELVLDYADQGFVIWYTVLMEQVGNTYLGCMANAYTNLYLWDPELTYTWAEGITRASGGEDREIIDDLNESFLPLEEATSMTLDEFYQTFQNPGNTTCLETPVELWPGP